MKWIDYELADDQDFVKSIWSSICREHSKEKHSPYVIGTTNVKKKLVNSHAKGSLHRSAIEAVAKGKQNILSRDIGFASQCYSPIWEFLLVRIFSLGFYCWCLKILICRPSSKETKLQHNPSFCKKEKDCLKF